MEFEGKSVLQLRALQSSFEVDKGSNILYAYRKDDYSQNHGKCSRLLHSLPSL